MRLETARTMRDADDRAIHVMGIPSTLLMTNAAAATAEEAMRLIGAGRSAAIFCGAGNNGGDGVGAAVYLIKRGISIRCFLVGKREKLTEDTAEMERRLRECGGGLEDFEPENAEQRDFVMGAGVIIDALFGIGLNSDIRGAALEAVELINCSPAPVVSADIASGVEADTGRILGAAVRADATVTFSAAKPGHFVEPGCTCRGRLIVADIGVPAELLGQGGVGAYAVRAADCALPRRPEISHKGDYGRLLIIGGSVGYTGAPVLCAKAAARCGAGLISVGVPEDIYLPTAARLLEPMPFPLKSSEGKISTEALTAILDKLSNSDVCVIGCGLGRGEKLTELVRAMLKTSAKPLVLDADGLYALGDDPETVKSAQTTPVLTPHEGEFARLGGILTGDRLKDAADFAKSRHCVLALKGHRTICAFPDGETFVIDGGNPGMAKGGSGDVLAGILGAMLCQLPLKRAVVTACAIHAAAGDMCAERLGEYAMLPSDMIAALPDILRSI